MGIKIYLDESFKRFAGGHSSVSLEASTVRECLDSLVNKYPPLKELLFDSAGNLISLVIFNDEAIIPGDLGRNLPDNSEIIVRPLIYGG